MPVLIYSAYSPVLNVNGVGDFPWLKDLTHPELNMQLEITGSDFGFAADMGQGAFDVIGRKLPVVVTDIEKGEKFDFTASLITKADEDRFDALWTTKRSLLLQLPDGRQWFLIMQKRKKRLPPGTGPFLEVDVNAIEADEPI